MANEQDRNNQRSTDLAASRSRSVEINREQMRKERVPVHKQNCTTLLNKEPGWHYRIVNDVYGRISKFLAAGYTIVEDSKTNTYTGDGKQESSQEGSQVWRTVNKGLHAPTHKAVLMRIPEDMYNADQDDKQNNIDKTEELIDKDGLIRQAQLMGPRANAIRMQMLKK